MSAAEKLKALGNRPNGTSTALARHDLYDALPQIVAVVEAAEDVALRIEEEAQNDRTYRLDAALAALDEALT